ncbi:hypothetical protein SNEBB_004931 [Seison nebaliae]|nr:hypothetical protein SNEBB_004931 [Seison nebaliae]
MTFETELNGMDSIPFLSTIHFQNLSDNISANNYQFDERMWQITQVIVILISILIIIFALIGNTFTILAFIKSERLKRFKPNLFLVSLATADIGVASFAMTFNAVQLIRRGWQFGSFLCRLWFCFDVLFTTASILHLCFISIDRMLSIYFALHYSTEAPETTSKRIKIFISIAWSLSFLIAFAPIYSNIFTTTENLEAINQLEWNHLDVGIYCMFITNPYYCAISSTISFWIPAIIIVIMYALLIQKANELANYVPGFDSDRNSQKRPSIFSKKEMRKSIYNCFNCSKIFYECCCCCCCSCNNKNKSSVIQKGNEELSDERTSFIQYNPSISYTINIRPSDTFSQKHPDLSKRANQLNYERDSIEHFSSNNLLKSTLINNKPNLIVPNNNNNPNFKRSSVNFVNLKAKNQIRKSLVQHERRAVRTFGRIMLAFLICFVPFFSRYTYCNGIANGTCYEWEFPLKLEDILFWIGYVNSTMNPFIYAFTHREFKAQFKKMLREKPFPKCIRDLKCLLSERPSFTNRTRSSTVTTNDVNERRSRLKSQTFLYTPT